MSLTRSGRDLSSRWILRTLWESWSVLVQLRTEYPEPNPNVPIDPATFQQQMFAMKNLLTQSIVANLQDHQVSASPAPPAPREPKIRSRTPRPSMVSAILSTHFSPN